MKKQLSTTFLIFIYCNIFCQTIQPEFGGAFNPTTQEQCLSKEQRTAINAQLTKNLSTLIQEGIINESDQNNQQTVGLDWPLKKAANFDFNSYFTITNYVDHNPSATGTQYGASNLDYNCGNRTYDTSDGYNHQGIDVATWPFPWYMYENNLVEVIAAEAGTIIGKDNGNVDDNCACSGNWNAVYIRHSDGSVAWYGHLKNNLLTNKSIGQAVTKGEYLGIVASSGCSTGPHLHFEVYNNANQLIDTYAGNCNSMNNSSWWTNQPAYRTPTMNALLTHNTPPVHGCPGTNESPNLMNTFTPGQTVYTAFYYQDQLINNVTNMRLRKPDNTIWQSWNHTSPNTYTSSWWYWSWNLPSNSDFGMWQLEADYQGQTLTHTFEYKDPNSCPTDIVVTSPPTNQSVVHASNTIATSGNVTLNNGMNITFKAGNQITLNKDFHVQAGATFLATIEDCNSVLRTESSPLKSIPTTEIPKKNKWSGEINPNPTTGEFRLSGLNNSEVMIVDKIGHIYMYFKASGNRSVDINHLHSGMYFVLIKEESNVYSKKIIKL